MPPIKITSADYNATVRYCDSRDVNFYIHCPYTANLAKNPWTKAQAVVERELQQIAGLRAACVLHIGRVGNLATVIEHLDVLEVPQGGDKVKRTLLLENAAGQGTELGDSWDQLRQVFEGIDTNKIGLCFDTQHAFAAGMQHWQDAEDVHNFFDNVESIGAHLGLIHLNDSAKEYLSRVDRHRSVGQGYIWTQSRAGLDELLARCGESGVDIIFETSDPNSDIAFVNSPE